MRRETDSAKNRLHHILVGDFDLGALGLADVGEKLAEPVDVDIEGFTARDARELAPGGVHEQGLVEDAQGEHHLRVADARAAESGQDRREERVVEHVLRVEMAETVDVQHGCMGPTTTAPRHF